MRTWLENRAFLAEAASPPASETGYEPGSGAGLSALALLLAALCICLLAPEPGQAQRLFGRGRLSPFLAPLPPAFPGAAGAGARTRGARACPMEPVLLTVNQLGDAGDGVCDESCTLRDALLTEWPRFVLFNVSGTLLMDQGAGLKSDLNLTAAHSCVTVAGQTSAGGVTIANAQLQLHEGFHDGIFRHLRIRPGIWEEVRGTVEGCNRWAWRCDEDPANLGAQPGESLEACREVCSGSCSPHEYGVFTSPNFCTGCAEWSPDDPDAFPGCNDRMLIHGNFLDALRIQGPARNIIIDSSSLTWASDEAVQIVGATPPAVGPWNITVQNSIIGAGNDSNDGTGGYVFPGHRRSPHNFGVFISTPEAGGEPIGMGGVSLLRNLIVHNDLRSPLISCGWVELINNVIYNGSIQDVSVLGRCRHMGLVAEANLFRKGPNVSPSSTRQFGYCFGGRTHGMACRAPLAGHESAACDVFVCRPTHTSFFHLLTDPYAARVWLDANRFENASGRPLPDSSGDGLDAQWSRAQVNDHRPAYSESSLAAPFRLGARLPQALDPDRLAAELLPGVGATLPARDDVDARLVAETELGLGGHALPEGGFQYPELDGPAWLDAEADGLCDRWEQAYCPDGDCAPLADLDRDGYANVEEWINGTDPLSAGSSDVPPGGC